MLNKVIEILDANSEETRHPQWGVVRLFTEDAIIAAAEQILTLLQPNSDSQPQLQQTPCKTLLPPSFFDWAKANDWRKEDGEDKWFCWKTKMSILQGSITTSELIERFKGGK